MESNVVRLEYSVETLAADRCRYEGTLTYVGKSLSFTGFDWEGVLESVSEALKESVDGHLVLKRREAPYPMSLPEGIEELLRTDLPAAIAALTVAPQRVVIGAPREKVSHGLRYGHETLADALGELIYIKANVRAADSLPSVEDPSSGRWEPLDERHARCRLNSPPNPGMDSRWLVVATEDLLALNLPRYYLPRRWNPSGGWINHDDLVSMYEAYKKEKSDATNE